MDRLVVVLALAALIAALTVWLRRRSPEAPARVDPEDFGLVGDGVAVVGFSSPYCLPCQRWESALRERGVPWTKVDVARRGDLATRYGVRQTPLVMAVELPAGKVVAAYADEPSVGDLERVVSLSGAAS